MIARGPAGGCRLAGPARAAFRAARRRDAPGRQPPRGPAAPDPRAVRRRRPLRRGDRPPARRPGRRRPPRPRPDARARLARAVHHARRAEVVPERRWRGARGHPRRGRRRRSARMAAAARDRLRRRARRPVDRRRARARRADDRLGVPGARARRDGRALRARIAAPAARAARGGAPLWAEHTVADAPATACSRRRWAGAGVPWPAPCGRSRPTSASTTRCATPGGRRSIEACASPEGRAARLEAGASRPARGLLGARLLADDSQATMRCAQALWALARPAVLGAASAPPRIWAT
jgi:hypothetical protein